MSFLSHVPVARKAIRHKNFVEAQLATLNERTNELGTGVLNTLLFDSAVVLDALGHLVADNRAHEQILTRLNDSIESFAALLEALPELVSPSDGRAIADQTSNEIESLRRELDAHLRSLAAAPPAQATKAASDAGSSSLVEQLLLELHQRLDSIASATPSARELSAGAASGDGPELSGRLVELTAQTSQLRTLVENVARENTSDRVAEALEQVKLALRTIPTSTSQLVRTAISDDLAATTEIIASELGSTEQRFTAMLERRANDWSAGLAEAGLTIRSALGREADRFDTRLSRDLDHLRSTLSSELAARGLQITADISRAEQAILAATNERDRLARAQEADDTRRMVGDVGAAAAEVRSKSEHLIVTTSAMTQRLAEVDRHVEMVSSALAALDAVLAALPQDVELRVVRRLDQLHGRLAASGIVVQPETTQEPAPEQAELSPSATRPRDDDTSRTEVIEESPDRADPEVALARHLAPFIEVGRAIDIGAHRGTWTIALSDMGFEVAAVEANPTLAAALADACADRSRVTVFGGAAAEGPGSATIQLVADGSAGRVFGDTTLLTTTVPDKQTDGLVYEPGPRVRTVSAEGVAASCGWGTEVGLIKIDTEGTELAVLQGLGDLHPEVCIVEFWGSGYLLNRHRDGTVLTDVNATIEAMIARGYRRWIAFTHVGDQVRAEINQRTFPAESWGNLVFFDGRDLLEQARTWCERSLRHGCR